MENESLEFSKVFEFLDYAGNKGVLNSNTTNALRAACTKINPFLETKSEKNVSWVKGNLEELYRRVANKDQSLTPSSLQSYKSRALKAVTLLEKWADNPTTWHQNLRTRRAGKKNNSGNVQPKKSGEEKHTPREEAIEISYPLRAGFNFLATIPRGLKMSEVKKIVFHLATYAEDFNPSADWLSGDKKRAD